MDLTNTINGNTDFSSSRDRRGISAECRRNVPLDPEVTLRRKSLIRNNSGNSGEDRDMIETARSSSPLSGRRSEPSQTPDAFSTVRYYS